MRLTHCFSDLYRHRIPSGDDADAIDAGALGGVDRSDDRLCSAAMARP